LDQPALSKKAKTYKSIGKLIGRGIKIGRRLLNRERNAPKGINKQSLLLINNTDMLVSLAKNYNIIFFIDSAYFMRLK
jgi:hypothetical protein